MTSHQLVAALNSEVAPLLQWSHETTFLVKTETKRASVKTETKRAAVMYITIVKIIAVDTHFPAINITLAEASASSPEDADSEAVEEFWRRFDLTQDRINDLNDSFRQNWTIPDLSFKDSVWWAIHEKANSRSEFELKAAIMLSCV